MAAIWRWTGFGDGVHGRPFMKFFPLSPYLSLPVCVFVLSACGEHDSKTESEAAAPGGTVVGQVDQVPAAAVVEKSAPKPFSVPSVAKKVFWTPEMLHTEIKYHNPDYDGSGEFNLQEGQPVAISLRGAKIRNLEFLTRFSPLALDLSGTPIQDIRPVRGMKLVELYLEDSPVTDISPLRGMPLEKIYLSRTPVSDLSALAGAPLVEVNVVDTKISDLTPLAKSPIQMLWLTGTPVESIAPLRGMPLVSLTLHRTKVVDLAPLSGSTLQRLHIAETPVSDLSPLKGLSLTRLVFTPANIKTGLEVAKSLPVQEIGTQFDEQGRDLMPPEAFWAQLAK